MKRLFSILALAIGLLAVPAFAAVTPNSAVTPQTPNRGVQSFVAGTDAAGTYKTVYTAGTNGSKCTGMWMTNSDGSATHLVTVQIVNAAKFFGGVSVTTVLGAGFNAGVPPQSLMSAAVWPGLPTDNNGNPTLILVSGDTIQATYATALTASSQINIEVTCSDF